MSRHVVSLASAALLVVAAATAFAVLVFRLHAEMPGDTRDVQVFDRMEFSADQGLSWQPVALPHEWRRNDLELREAWYRITFPLRAPSVALSTLYIPTLSQNVALYLNGVEIGNGGRLDPPVARHWPRPLSFPVAPEYVNVTRNELLIWVVSGEAGNGMLGPVYLGDPGILGKALADRTLLKLTVPTASSVVLSIFALLLCSITLRKPDDTQYAWGGCALLFLAGHSLPLLISRIPVSEFFWAWWQHACIGAAVTCILVFTHRFLGLRHPRIELAAGLLVLLSALLWLAIGIGGAQQLYYDWAGRYWGFVALLIGGLSMLQMSRSLLVQPSVQKIVMLGAGSMLFVFGAHDALFVAGYLSMRNGYLVHYASPVVALIFTAILFARFAQASRMAEELNRTLERRIEQKSTELENTYQRLQRLEKERLIAAERERFNRDLHDGLGGYLAGALAMAERHGDRSSNLVATLRDATDEMRLMIDSAEASGNDPGMILGGLRPKLQRHLEQSGMQLEWRILDTHPIGTLGPAAAMQLIRFLQEAITNATRHSGGSRVRVFLRNDGADAVLLSVEDDGRCTRTTRAGGHGMQNLSQRAAQLGAHLQIDSEGELGGLSLTLRWQAQRVLPGAAVGAEQRDELEPQAMHGKSPLT